MATVNSIAFLRVYFCLFAPLLVLVLFVRALIGMSLWKLIFFLALACFPLSLILMFVMNRLSNSLVNGLYGFGKKEDHSEEICRGEIMKLIPLKEEGRHELVLGRLIELEEQYGISSRIIYERAQCLLELGDLRKARRCISDYLSASQEGDDDPYTHYCRQLISHKDAPLTLENIARQDGDQRERVEVGRQN